MRDIPMKPERVIARFNANAGRHLLCAFTGWAVFFILSAVFLPALDSHVKPPPLTLWNVVVITGVLKLYTAIAIPTYLYQSWLTLPTAPNKTVYGLWIGLESLLLVGMELGAVYLLLHMVYGIWPR
jgi:hypothetical protein